MPRLVVIRHAKSDYPWGVTDHDRPLNERGRRDAPALGQWLDAHVDWGTASAPVVLVSTARRAQLTWALARTSLSARWDGLDERDEGRIYEAPVRDLVEVIADAAGDAETVLLVGHNPGVSGLVATLARPSTLRDEACGKYPTSAVAILETDVPLRTAVTSTGAFDVTDFAVPRG